MTAKNNVARDSRIINKGLLDLAIKDDPKAGWTVATKLASEIRTKKRDIAVKFLEIGDLAYQIKASEVWKHACETWDDFCRDSEIGLGMSPSTVRNYIGIWQFFVEGGFLTADEASICGVHLLNASKGTLRKIAAEDMERAKEILIEGGKTADIARELRDLVPEQERNVEQLCGTLKRGLNRQWSALNEIEPADMDEAFRGEMHRLLDRMQGYLMR